MKILFVTRHFYPIDRPSGVVSLLIEMALSLLEMHHDVSILCVRKKGESDQYFDQHGLKVYKFDQFSPGSLQNIVEKEDPDRIIVFSSISAGSLMIAWWLWMVLKSGIADKTSFYQTTNLRVNFVSKKLFQCCQSVLSGFYVANSDIAKVIGAKSASIVLPSVNLNRITKLAESVKEECFTVCFMGHLTHVKGADRVIELAQRLPDVNFKLVAGYSPGKKNIEFYNNILASLKSTSNVVHHPFCNNPIEVLSECHLLVLPYRSGVTVLGVAQSAIEAMVIGIPLISTDNSSVTELLEEGVNGLYCNSVDSMEKAILRIMNDRELYQSLVAGCTKTTETNFNVHNQVKKLIQQ